MASYAVFSNAAFIAGRTENTLIPGSAASMSFLVCAFNPFCKIITEK